MPVTPPAIPAGNVNNFLKILIFVPALVVDTSMFTRPVVAANLMRKFLFDRILKLGRGRNNQSSSHLRPQCPIELGFDDFPTGSIF